MSEYPDFEQNLYSRTAEGICKVGHDTLTLLKRMPF